MAPRIIQPANWAPARGYSNGILSANQLFIGGQIGWNAEQVFKTSDFVGQMEQALRNIVTVLEAAGGQVSDIVRLTWYIVDKKEYLARQQDVGAAYRRVMGRHYPAMSVLVVADLIEDAALVEIDATAVFGTPTETG